MKGQEETIENNKLIAEFMGRKGKVNNHLYWVNIPNSKWVSLEEMKFHSSWDWLMPVVEKIETFIFEDDEYYNFHILGGCSVYVISSHGNELIYSDKEQSKLECLWIAVVEFIKWYNNDKEKENY